jgi:transposase
LRTFAGVGNGAIQKDGLQLSRGELVAILQPVATRAKQAVGAIRDAIRQRPGVHGEETGWRENGQSRYVWGFSTPWLRYFVFGSRRGEMVDEVLGADCQAVLVTDFYAAYDHYPGLHQRYWVHLLRDVHALREKHPHDAGVQAWAKAVVACSHEAKAVAASGPPAGLSAGQERIWRRQQRRAAEQALSAVCQPFAGKGTTVPQQVLCQRIQKYLPELFTFLADARVPADNNPAERSVRSVVVRRTISGGSRSAAGTLARTRLWTLTDTWQIQGRSLLPAWVALLRNPADAACATVTPAD